MCWCRATLPHSTDFCNLMSFWTITPQNRFQSAGLLSIKVMLYIWEEKKNGWSQNSSKSELLNCGMQKRWFPLSGTSDFPVACGSLHWGAHICAAFGWRDSFMGMRAWSPSPYLSSLTSPRLQIPGPSPEQQDREPAPRSSGGTGSTDTAFFHQGNESRFTKSLWQMLFFFFKPQKNFSFLPGSDWSS